MLTRKYLQDDVQTYHPQQLTSSQYDSGIACLPMYNAKEFVQGLTDAYSIIIKNKDNPGMFDLHTSKSLNIPIFQPFTPNRFIQNGSKDSAAWFTSFVTTLEGFKKFTILDVVQDGCVLHEVGVGNPQPIMYYNRWVKEGETWKIDFETPLLQPSQEN